MGIRDLLLGTNFNKVKHNSYSLISALVVVYFFIAFCFGFIISQKSWFTVLLHSSEYSPENGPGLANLNLSQHLHTKLHFPKLYYHKDLESMQKWPNQKSLLQGLCLFSLPISLNLSLNLSPLTPKLIHWQSSSLCKHVIYKIWVCIFNWFFLKFGSIQTA